MNLTKLIKELQSIEKEICTAHNHDLDVDIIKEGENDLIFYDIEKIEPITFSCGCWQGAKIYIKENKK